MRVIIALAFACLLTSDGAAGVGATQSEFLKIGLSARAASMGGAFGAVADDLGALEYNPAGLANLTNSQVSAMYTRWLADISFGAVAGAHVVPFLGCIAVGVSMIDVGEIEGSEKKFSSESFLFRAAWGRNIVGPLNLGIGAKVMQEKISDFNSSGGTMDVGVLFTPVSGFSLGAAVMNVGWVSAFEEVKDSLPAVVKMAGAWKALESDYGMLIAALDVDYFPSPANIFSPAIGAEYWGGRYFAIRAGYQLKETDLSSEGAGISLGVGVRWQTLRVDYAYAPFSDLGVTNRVTLNWEVWPLITLPVPGSSVGEVRTTAAGALVPPAPPMVTAEAGEGSVLVKWEAPQATNVSGFNVYYRKENRPDFVKCNEEPVSGNSILVRDLERNVRHTFVVRAVDASLPPRESAPSPQASAIPY